MPVALIPAAAGLINAGVNAFGAGHREKLDKEELARLHAPFYKIQKEFGDIANSAEETAQGGLTIGAKDLYSDLAGRGLGTAISGTEAVGGSPNDINRIFQSYNDSARNVAAADSEAQIKNIAYYHNAAKELAGQKIIQFGVNEFQPYQNKLKELTQRIAADKLNLHNSINSGIESIQAGVTAGMNDRLFRNSTASFADDPFSSEHGAPGVSATPHQGSPDVEQQHDESFDNIPPEILQAIKNYMNRPQ